MLRLLGELDTPANKIVCNSLKPLELAHQVTHEQNALRLQPNCVTILASCLPKMEVDNSENDCVVWTFGEEVEQQTKPQAYVRSLCIEQHTTVVLHLPI